MTEIPPNLVEVFPLPDWLDPCDAPGLKTTRGSSCGSTCGCGDEPPQPLVLADELERFRGEHPEAELQVRGYDDDAVDLTLARLNTILEASNQQLRVDRASLTEVMRQIGPLVAVAGRLAIAGVIPTAEQLAHELRRRAPTGA